MTRLHQTILTLLCLLTSAEALAVDSYRYLHVTIDTPWAIFIVLLPIVLSPFILMAILYWRFAKRRPDAAADDESDQGQNSIDQNDSDQPGGIRHNENQRVDDA